ncbi:serine/threonine protein kinase [Helicocarpus griseus UAMH5409]|uniref:Serine/threonine protein kinase n=1 Tax=Helicocarpus griseus UAMH5409 TaxID=1447875 RepID=A0A2B7XRP9_9EURO|nr:serine/threonine protein kinase [Helicocarpus griseus UAMH5409]
MTSLLYRSAFASEPTDISGNSFSEAKNKTSDSPEVPEWSAQGSLASFICHAAHLQNELRSDDSIFFDDNNEIKALSKKRIGIGASFLVERAEWSNEVRGLGSSSQQSLKLGKYVAVKTVLERSTSRMKNNWSDVALELRALMHKPLRYHPNIVRLLGLGWGSSTESGSVYPAVILEYATFGSMRSLQNCNPPLPFAIKQKLCYDVARGLSIIHACGIVHGDIKHENVLIFTNKYRTPEGQPYIAKLADFGGAVMDISEREQFNLRMRTYPYHAPEFSSRLSAEGIKQTDVYSFGLLVWRTFIDCGDIAAELGLDSKATDASEKELQKLGINNDLLVEAVCSIQAYASKHKMSENALALFLFVLAQTLLAEPRDRSLSRAQAALRGMKLNEIELFLQKVATANEQRENTERNESPGTHGLTVDGLGFFLGNLGDDYDCQNNVPGYRPKLSHPDIGEFMFEPEKLKGILDWTQQQQMVYDLKEAARQVRPGTPDGLQPWKAAYYLFQCYLTEFGVTFDAEQSCHWLMESANAGDKGDVDYWAMAWFWRVSTALSVPIPPTLDELQEFIRWGLIRGHMNCLEDGRTVISRLTNKDEQERWENMLSEADWARRTIAGGIGMPHFVPRKLRRCYDLNDTMVLEAQIKEELGAAYQSCLRKTHSGCENSAAQSRNNDAMSTEGSQFDKIYVNHKGHGLLHMAATLGKLKALRYMIETYMCDINIPNTSLCESPLVCACRSGHYGCAMLLLESGARGGATDLGEEAPLHWLCSFTPEKMEPLAKALINAGANIEHACGRMRKDVRMINADWEDNFGIATTPLGRAVLMRSLPAVKVLLGLGANPLVKVGHKEDIVVQSPVELAAVLTLPQILETLLLYVDQVLPEKPLILDEVGMLCAAHEKRITPYDPTSLQTRLVRCGLDYKRAMFRTLQILRRRHERLQDWRNINSESMTEGMQLCQEVKLGNVDIVEALLELGHDPNGSPGYRPIEEAVTMNHAATFRLLVNHGAKLGVKRAMDNGTQFTLLKLSASRARTSRDGTFIAEYLIRSGIPIESLPDGSPSSLSLAIKNRHFDLADVLLDKGADINAVYQFGKGEEWITILCELLLRHTEATFQSVDYIIRKLDTSTNSIPKADFIVNKTRNLTALHLLALCLTKGINDRSQITARIIQNILRVFHTSDHINRVHPTLGTALCIACVTGNLEMATALLAYKADLTIPMRIDQLSEADRKSLRLSDKELGRDWESKELTPLLLAQAAFAMQLSELEKSPPAAIDDLSELESLQAIVSLLQNAGDLPSDPAWSSLTARRKLLEDRMKLNSSMTELARSDIDLSEPVDLSVLTEEKGTNWKEGDKMNQETVTRTMLKFMRGGFD